MIPFEAHVEMGDNDFDALFVEVQILMIPKANSAGLAVAVGGNQGQTMQMGFAAAFVGIRLDTGALTLVGAESIALSREQQASLQALIAGGLRLT